jgi:hypothetical protein
VNVGHDLINIALGIVSLALSGLIRPVFNRLRRMEDVAQEQAIEIRDTRSALARLEGHLNLQPFPYEKQR